MFEILAGSPVPAGWLGPVLGLRVGLGQVCNLLNVLNVLNVLNTWWLPGGAGLAQVYNLLNVLTALNVLNVLNV